MAQWLEPVMASQKCNRAVQETSLPMASLLHHLAGGAG